MECDSGPGGGSSHTPVDSSEDESWNYKICSGEKREVSEKSLFNDWCGRFSLSFFKTITGQNSFAK